MTRHDVIFYSHYFDCYHLPSRWRIVPIAELQSPLCKRLFGRGRFC